MYTTLWLRKSFFFIGDLIPNFIRKRGLHFSGIGDFRSCRNEFTSGQRFVSQLVSALMISHDAKSSAPCPEQVEYLYHKMLVCPIVSLDRNNNVRVINELFGWVGVTMKGSFFFFFFGFHPFFFVLWERASLNSTRSFQILKATNVRADTRFGPHTSWASHGIYSFLVRGPSLENLFTENIE